MPTYFGLCDSSGNATQTGTDDFASIAAGMWNVDANTAFICPGSGSQTVKEISADVHLDSGTIHVRLAIYNLAGTTKIGEGNSSPAISGASDSWQGHMTQSDISPNPCTLIGGTHYLLGVAWDSSGTIATTHCLATIGNGRYNLADYTVSPFWPSSLPTGTNYGIWPIRCGVDPEAALLDQEGFRFRLDDGNEAGATWDGNQDANLTKAAGNERLRFILDGSGDPAANAYQLEWSKVGEDVWRKVEN